MNQSQKSDPLKGIGYGNAVETGFLDGQPGSVKFNLALENGVNSNGKAFENFCIKLQCDPDDSNIDATKLARNAEPFGLGSKENYDIDYANHTLALKPGRDFSKNCGFITKLYEPLREQLQTDGLYDQFEKCLAPNESGVIDLNAFVLRVIFKSVTRVDSKGVKKEYIDSEGNTRTSFYVSIERITSIEATDAKPTPKRRSAPKRRTAATATPPPKETTPVVNNGALEVVRAIVSEQAALLPPEGEKTVIFQGKMSTALIQASTEGKCNLQEVFPLFNDLKTRATCIENIVIESGDTVYKI